MRGMCEGIQPPLPMPKEMSVPKGDPPSPEDEELDKLAPMTPVPGGMLTFGGYDTAHFEGPLEYIPLSNTTYWQVPAPAGMSYT